MTDWHCQNMGAHQTSETFASYSFWNCCQIILNIVTFCQKIYDIHTFWQNGMRISIHFWKRTKRNFAESFFDSFWFCCMYHHVNPDYWQYEKTTLRVFTSFTYFKQFPSNEKNVLCNFQNETIKVTQFFKLLKNKRKFYCWFVP